MTSSWKIIVAVSIVGSILLAGCYTQLMTPQEFTKGARHTARPEMSQTVSYNNCLSCHSRNELDDRYIDLKYYGIQTVHEGIVLDPIAWNNPYTSPDPDAIVDYGWPRPTVNVMPWWLPPATSINTNEPQQEKSRERVRTSGATRDNNTRTRTPDPVSTYTPTTTSTGSTTPSNPQPATSVAQPSTQTQQANTSNSGRTRDTNATTTASPRTRDNGSTRDDGERKR